MVTQNSWGSQDPAQVAKGGTGVATTTAYAVQCGGTTATGPFQPIASVGTANQVLTSNGAGALPTFQDAPTSSGQIVQRVSSIIATQSSTTTVMPGDNTIPQNTEGAEYDTLAITPTSATNRLRVMFISYLANSPSAGGALALFVDTDADALTTVSTAALTNSAGVALLTYDASAASTSARTYKIRFGPASSGTGYMNRFATQHTFGGTSYAYFYIEEYTA